MERTDGLAEGPSVRTGGGLAVDLVDLPRLRVAERDDEPIGARPKVLHREGRDLELIGFEQREHGALLPEATVEVHAGRRGRTNGAGGAADERHVAERGVERRDDVLFALRRA